MTEEEHAETKEPDDLDEETFRDLDVDEETAGDVKGGVIKVAGPGEG